MFREIIPVYTENHRKPIKTLCGQNAELLGVFHALARAKNNLRAGHVCLSVHMIQQHCWETMGNNNSHCCATTGSNNGFHGWNPLMANNGINQPPPPPLLEPIAVQQCNLGSHYSKNDLR
jgi:hypothetical protein